MTSGHLGGVLTRTGVPGGAWTRTGDLGGMRTMIGSLDVVQMMTGALGETWMMIGFLDLVPGDHMLSQVDGERRKKPEKKAGVHLENQDQQKNVTGIGIKKGIEMVRIVRRMRKTLTENGTESEMWIVKTASEDQEMKVAGEEDQLKNLRAGEIRVVEMTEIGMIVVGREMIGVI